ncbi:MAG: NUDIX domain-containing protein [Planctomycetota bacterium]|nr:MAG: NUDIX domain-containing protein [Planctomycetota bacterium]
MTPHHQSTATATVIAVAVVVAGDSVLVGRRSAMALDAAGLAEFPGGKLEAGESAAHAAARECLEETGLAVRIGALLEVVPATSSAGNIEIRFFAAAPLPGPVIPRPPFAWLPMADLAQLPFPTANRRILERLIAGTILPPSGDQGGS